MCFGHLRTTTECTFPTSELPKMLRTWCVLHSLTSTCATVPNVTCFQTFYFQPCFAPQRRALFRHLNFQRWSQAVVFCAFRLPNLLRHNGVQLFIFHLASWLRTRRVSELTLRPSAEPTRQWKNTLLCGFPTLFVHLHLLSSDFLHLWLVFSISHFFPSGFLHAGVSSWMCVSICPYCRKFDF